MPSDPLSVTFAALADPTRRAILGRLIAGERSVTELAEPFDMSMPAVSKHLRVLERAGLIARGREAQWRPCRIEAAPLKEVAEWAERYRHIWETRFDRLDTYLQQMKTRAPRRNPMPVSSAANSRTFKVTTPSDTDIVMTRVFDAPRHLVFEALTKPEHVRRWWGILDDKHSVPVCEIDLRVGGAWRFVGRGPDGDIPAFYGEYREITPPERLVNTEILRAVSGCGIVGHDRVDRGGRQDAADCHGQLSVEGGA